MCQGRLHGGYENIGVYVTWNVSKNHHGYSGKIGGGGSVLVLKVKVSVGFWCSFF